MSAWRALLAAVSVLCANPCFCAAEKVIFDTNLGVLFSRYPELPGQLKRLAPTGVDCAEAAKRIPLKVSRKGKETRYETYLPYDVFGLNYDIIRNRGFRFNLLVNDNDGFGGVDCWTEIKPGIATDKNAAEYPWVRFR